MISTKAPSNENIFYRTLDKFKNFGKRQKSIKKDEEGFDIEGSSSEVTEDNENEYVPDPLQMDATYLAVNLAFIPDYKRSSFNMDTSEDKPLFL